LEKEAAVIMCSHWYQIDNLWWSILTLILFVWGFTWKMSGYGLPWWIARFFDWIEAAMRATGKAAPAIARRWIRQLAVEKQAIRKGVRDATTPQLEA
jgi:hypothetical protein